MPSDLPRLVPQTTPDFTRILDPGRSPPEAPVRSEIFGLERFAQHGRSLGETHRVREGVSRSSFFPRLEENIRVLRDAQAFIGRHAATGYHVTPAAEWLLDNFHLIEAQLDEIHAGLPRRYFRDLPVLIDEPLAGLPRVYSVAWAFVAHTDGAFDEDLLVRFLSAYQETRELTLGELWALPTTLRVVLVENLRRLAERLAIAKAARELANLVGDQLERYDTARLDELRDWLARRGADRTFLVQLAQRLQDQHATGLSVYRDWLLKAIPELAAAQVQQPAEQAADNLSVSNAIGSLRLIGHADWPKIVDQVSPTMRMLLRLPDFSAERADTRDQTLHEVERLARVSGRSESAVTEALIRRVEAATGAEAVVHHWLNGPGRPVLTADLGLDARALDRWQRWRHRFALPAYLGTLTGGTALVVGWMLLRDPTGVLHASRSAPGGFSGFALGTLAALSALLLAFPASEAVVAVLNRLIGESARPSRLPRLALAHGIPAEHRVLVVVPALLTGRSAIDELVHRLELHHLSNPERHAQFGLLSDWIDAPTETLPDDVALLSTASDAIHALNMRYPAVDGQAPRFLLLHRGRSFSASEQAYIGRERKRGKLERLIALLAGAPGVEPFLDLGDRSRLEPGIRYLVTLDGDTQLPPGRLRELVGIAAHPHNAPSIDPQRRVVRSGYAILQPRVVTPLPAPREVTPYHWLFAGQPGIDPYSVATSEVYQDVFGEGTFTGKGLLVVDAMHAVLGGRLPDDSVLSHDLLEGSIARCAAVTDVTIVEEAPAHADVAASRVHRWTRGDWQLLPFLVHAGRYGLRAINRWKMVDNLRRSLVAPMSLALIVCALATDAVGPWHAVLLVYAALTAGPLLGAVAGLAPSRDGIALGHFYRQALVEVGRAILSGLWLLAELLQLALTSLDAVGRALWRMTVSRRRLLQWTPAAAAQAAATTDLRRLIRRHRATPIAAALIGLLLAAVGTREPRLAGLLCVAWAGAPVWTWWVSRPRRPGADAALPAADREVLDETARDTWRLFERLVGDGDRHLPPDNLQLTPQTLVAHRTSPTNIGLYLLATCCARRFGWIGSLETADRLEATLGTLGSLARHRGHFLNWYDTRSGAALLPQYVSTVDSGNLSGHLLAAAEACRELARAPFDRAPSRAALRRSAARLAALDSVEGRPTAGPLTRLLALNDPWSLIADGAAGFDAALQAASAELAARASDDSAALNPDPLDRWCWLASDHLATLRSVRADLDAELDANGFAHRLRTLAERLEALAWEPDYGFLYHPKRHLFHIGFRVAEQQLDSSFYDLLASESRLTSLLAIAKGDVPVAHWAALGRPFFAVGGWRQGYAGLRSWSGSMFEYLMPTLVLDEPQGSVLRNACLAAIREQIDFGREQRVPWGISESAYAGADHTLAYQYAPQGVPRLALRRTPPDELVVAPYATALAAQVMPHAAVANLARIGALTPRARYGFIEALDFSAGRQTATSGFARVDTFMAHHQAMGLISIANVLLDEAPRRWGMANPHVEAVASLLHERAPRELPRLSGPPPGPSADARQRRGPGFVRELTPGMNALPPTQLLGNGRYSVALRANGAGWSRWNDIGLNRTRDDALRDAYGHFFYLRWDRQPQAVSLTQHPAPDPSAHYQSTFQADRVTFDASWPEIEARTTVWVSPEDDIEFRQIELRNRGERTLPLELMSAFEITLAAPSADESHPAFSNLFIRAGWRPGQQALMFERKPRLPTDAVVHAAHFLVENDPAIVELRVQTDRLGWRGRNRDPGSPLASFDLPPAPPAGAPTETTTPYPLDTGLDPVCAMLVRLQLAPLARIRLTFCTAAGDQPATLDAVIDKHRQRGPLARASLMSATLAGIRLRELAINPESLAAIQTLTSAVLMTLARPRSSDAPPAPRDTVEACDRKLLWRFGISGDRPIVLVSSGTPQGIGLIRSLTQALRIWGWSRVGCDLVVINAEPASYLMTLNRELTALREDYDALGGGPGSGSTGLHVLKADDISADELSTMRSLARVHLNADGRPLTHSMQEWAEQHDAAMEERQTTSIAPLRTAATVSAEPRESEGRFSANGAEFRFDAGAAQRPARPWVNVIANPDFGTQVSEAGGGYSWAVNSRLNQLTPWSNDPLADPPGEWFVLQDLRTRETWTVTASAWGDPAAIYRVAHGQGYTTISHRRGELEVAALICVDRETAVKQVRIRLINRGHRTMRLRVLGIAEWVLGGSRSDRGSTETAAFSARLEGTPETARRLAGLTCTQRDRTSGFGGGTAFLALATDAAEPADWTCDRRELFDARGRIAVPDDFGQRSGFGYDPCAALSVGVALASGESAERVFLLGYGPNPADARRLATTAAAVAPQLRLESARAAWDELLGSAIVSTPDPLFDAMVNRWLLYQAVGCRLWAKAGFYQAGGAFGFRDQLQDAMALAWAAPAMLRRQIVLNASRQFPEGDVQHWWHAPTGAGVRTHFSDDLLWLPVAVAMYVERTGDLGLLDEDVAFIEGGPIPEGAEDAYYAPTVSEQRVSVYEHGARAIDKSLKVGAHGLPLMGVGDWNDGMNRVAAGGRGESVWLAWFLCRLVTDYAPIARGRGETARARRWEEAARKWRDALQTEAWDGDWYKRAFFDDGTPLGSQANTECRIDLIAQSWATISGAAPEPFARRALDALDAHLVDRDAGLVRLLTPALQDQRPTAGYIQAYPPGVRENGGQYSHAGVWAMIAQSMAGDADAAYRYFTYLSPAHRAADAGRRARYLIEPYVMAGDVYAEPPYVGRGGWSWYTGSAAWMHRAAIEHFFGVDQRAGELRFDPRLPSAWGEASITLRQGSKRLRVIVRRRDPNRTTAAEPWRRVSTGETVRWAELGVDETVLIETVVGAVDGGPTSARRPPRAESNRSEGLPTDGT